MSDLTEQWKKAYECVVSENEYITTLKELLKECEHINIRLQNALWQWNEESELYEECDKIEAKINQALGEDK